MTELENLKQQLDEQKRETERYRLLAVYAADTIGGLAANRLLKKSCGAQERIRLIATLDKFSSLLENKHELRSSYVRPTKDVVAWLEEVCRIVP